MNLTVQPCRLLREETARYSCCREIARLRHGLARLHGYMLAQVDRWDLPVGIKE